MHSRCGDWTTIRATGYVEPEMCINGELLPGAYFTTASRMILSFLISKDARQSKDSDDRQDRSTQQMNNRTGSCPYRLNELIRAMILPEFRLLPIHKMTVW